MKLAARIVVFLAVGCVTSSVQSEDFVYKQDGLIRVKPYPMEDKFKNPPWPAEMEKAFWERANSAIKPFADNKGGATTGEHEKWGYPKAMAAVLCGNAGPNLAYLQAPDGEQPHTLNVDFYWCFCLKNQPRKYFWFGKHAGMLDAKYLETMRKAAAIWTKEDPKPGFEYYAFVNHPDKDVREYVLSMLRKLRVPAKDLPALIAQSKFEPFRTYMNGIGPKWTDEDFGDSYDKWFAWAKLLGDGDWQTYEEYERLANPNPHPREGHGTGPIGSSWDPATRGLWVDGRNTDNLRSMRETCVYLFAEEIGNERIRKLYKARLTRFVTGLYHTGMGEWDSETYHGHSIAPWLGLYDFAKDPEVRMLGKAALDWLVTAAALKYYRGGFGGPSKRDYGGANSVFGAGISHLMYLYFGDCPIADPDPHEDNVHAVMSNYRPPPAVVALARKDFARPVEMRDTKPNYSHWLPGKDERPEFWETLFFGNTYYLGTCVCEGGSGDVGPFKMLAYNSKRGCDFIVGYSGPRWNTLRRGDQIAQYRNLVVHLRSKGDTFSFLLPKTAAVQDDGGVWFVKMEKTWLAIRPIGLEKYSTGAAPAAREGAKYKDEMVLSAKASGGDLSGYAMEVGEEPTSYDAFKAAVKAKGNLTPMGVRPGYTLTGSDGRTLQAAYNKESDLPGMACDGKRREWSKELDIYRPADARGPVSLGWKKGELRVEAGGKVFTCSVSIDGKVAFDNK